MNAVLALTSNMAAGPTVGMINVLLVFVLLVAAILLIIAFFLIRSSRRTVNKYAYEQQTSLPPRLQEDPYQDAEREQSLSLPEKKQELQEWGQIEEGQLKQCPFCGTEVLPGGIFCLYCGQRLPIAGSTVSSPTEQASAGIWEQPTQEARSSASDAAYGGAIEEHPTLVEEIAAVAAPEKPEEKEQPVQIEDVKTIPVERLEKREEEIEELTTKTSPTPVETSLMTLDSSQKEQGEKQETPVKIEDVGNVSIGSLEKPQEGEEQPATTEAVEEKVEPVEEEEKGEEEQPALIEQEELPTENVTPVEGENEEEAKSEQAEQTNEHVGHEIVEEENEEPERQEDEQGKGLSSPTAAEEMAGEITDEETVAEVVGEEIEEQGRQEEDQSAEEEKEQDESQPKQEEEEPALIEEVATPREAEGREEEQPPPLSEMIQEEQDESQKKWIEEQPTVIEMPAVTAEKQEEPADLNMVEQSGYLILRKLNGKPVREYPLNRPVVTIGRARDNDIVIPRDKLTSRHHATIRYEHGHYALYDEHSANGTFVNGDEIEAGEPYVLHDADAIGVGAYEFTYRTASALMKEVDHLPTAKVSSVTIDDMAAHGPQEAAAVQEERTAVIQEEEADKESAGEEEEEEKPNEITGRKAAVIVSEVQYRSPQVLESRVAPLEADDTLLESLRFTAYHPQEVAVEGWNTLLVYAYVESALQAVYQDVNLLLREMGSGVHRSSGSLANGIPPLLPPGTNITVVPECRGVLFNPRRVTLQWSEDWHRAIFRFSARREMAGLSRTGRINVFAGPLLVGTLRMAMIFDEQERIDPLMIEDAAITVKPYRSIYTSYSPYDQNVMHATQEMYRVLGFNSLLKVDQLRSNQVLSETVRAGIEQAEVFQLFWSQQAAKSAFVRQEWEYALQLNRGEGFMRPVYWEVPLVKPPATLTPFYFSYLPTYAFTSS